MCMREDLGIKHASVYLQIFLAVPFGVNGSREISQVLKSLVAVGLKNAVKALSLDCLL
jgi:hypothetical protein